MRYRLLILAAFLVTGCTTTPAPTVAAIHTPHQLPAQIPSDGLLYLPLESTGTPEASPTLLVEAVIIDAVTHQPVPAVKCRTSLYQGWSANLYQGSPAKVYQAA